MKPTKSRWKTISTKRVYDNPWIQVQEDKIINPSGNQGIYGKVSFKNLAVAIIPIDQEDYTWIVGQYRYTLDQYSWELPMGGVPHDEDLISGAKRELLEETGIIAKKWTRLLELHPSNSVTDELAYTFIAEDLTIGSPRFEETEDLQIKRLPFRELLDLALTGHITDGLSVASILKYARIKGF
jgi:8-oxo-dGTP pyrophosphatase MutT (NUDIX family)